MEQSCPPGADHLLWEVTVSDSDMTGATISAHPAAVVPPRGVEILTKVWIICISVLLYQKYELVIRADVPVYL